MDLKVLGVLFCLWLMKKVEWMLKCVFRVLMWVGVWFFMMMIWCLFGFEVGDLLVKESLNFVGLLYCYGFLVKGEFVDGDFSMVILVFLKG